MQKDSKIYLIGGLILAVIIIGLVIFAGKTSGGPGKLDEFATCIKDSGATFYGAFWCTHCRATKALFGNSAKKLPYVECSTSDGNGQIQICIDKKINSYPTWIFKDGSELTGEVSLQQLSEKTNCPITPGAVVSTSTSATTTVTSATSSAIGTSTTIKLK